MEGTAIPITKVLASKIFDDGALELTTIKADHLIEKTSSHGVVVAAGGNVALIPAIAGNGSKALAANSGATALEFVSVGKFITPAKSNNSKITIATERISIATPVNYIYPFFEYSIPPNHNRGTYRLTYEAKTLGASGGYIWITACYVPLTALELYGDATRTKIDAAVTLTGSTKQLIDTTYTEYTTDITVGAGARSIMFWYYSGTDGSSGYIKNMNIKYDETIADPFW
jgi:hypothetical protein